MLTFQTHGRYDHVVQKAKEVSERMAARYPKKGMLTVGQWRRPTKTVETTDVFGVTKTKTVYMTDEELGL